MALNAPASELRMFIVDVLRHDAAESLATLLRLLNNDGCIGWRVFWPHDFEREEVLAALEELIRAGMVEQLVLDQDGVELVAVARGAMEFRGDAEEIWFALTPKGKAEWERWQPPVQADN